MTVQDGQKDRTVKRTGQSKGLDSHKDRILREDRTVDRTGQLTGQDSWQDRAVDMTGQSTGHDSPKYWIG